MSRRLLFRSCSLFLRSSLVRCSFYATSSSAAPVQQFPEPDKERVLQLADTFEASKKSTKAFVVIMDRFRKWVEENNQPAPSSIVKLLLPICLGSRNTHDIDIAVDYIKRRGWKADEEGLMNSFIVSMVKSGQYTKALEIYQRINDSGKRLRLTGICALLEAAADEGDFPTMLTLSQELKKTKAISVKHTYMHTSSIKHVLLACKGVEDTVAMEATSELLDTLRICRLKLNQEMACVIEEWAER